MSKSPFIIIEDFISPLLCEELVDSCYSEIPDTNEDGIPIPSIKINRLAEVRLAEAIELILVDHLEKYYGFEYKGLHPMEVEWYPEGVSDNKQRCENSIMVKQRGKNIWYRSNSKDFCGVIFLKDYVDKAPLDPYHEVMGGKLQFLNHNFSINPKRGTLVLFPGEQHFINCTSDIHVGDLHQIRFYLAATKPYMYDSKQFPGNYTTWF